VQVSVIICLFTKIVGCGCQVTHGRRTVPYSSTYILLIFTTCTVDENGVHLKITTFSCINLKNIFLNYFY